MAVEVNVRQTLNRTETRGLASVLRRAGGTALRHEGVRGRTVSALLTDDEEMRELNQRWRNLGRTTDVLSFEGGGEVLGDVVISLPAARRQAKRFHVTLEMEVSRLMIHGVLHLLGHDHRTAAERRAMNALTESIMKSVAR
jgi:probable rRNA maturation factor